MKVCSYIDRTVDFLRRIGLAVVIETPKDGFLDHVAIHAGVLVVDCECPPSHLLHEAGHLAIMPAQYRRRAGSDISEITQIMLDDYKGEPHPDTPLARAIIQSGECEATAWAWAAGVAIELPPKVIIRNSEYEGTGADVRMAVNAGCYFGVHGLAHAGFCRLRGPDRFPAMMKWIHPVIPPEPPSSGGGKP